MTGCLNFWHTKGSRKKKSSFPETDFDKKKFHQNFWAKRAIFLGKYFKKSVNTVSFPSDN